jgi:transcriptional regulator with GAF, ATPase, and Fis domain
MNRIINLNEVWYTTFCDDSTYLQQTVRTIQQQKFTLQKWSNKSIAVFGIIFISGLTGYEQLISFLSIQLTGKGNRVIIINTDEQHLCRTDVLKILNYGAEYFFERSFIDDGLECVIEKLLRWRNVESILNAPMITNHIIGESPVIKQLLRSLIEVSIHSEVSILIEGERGTGKELISKIVHELDKKRSNGNLVIVDCTTIRPELSGSEFFGHEKGSFTGAEHTRDGAFALANNGTLFLDEVGETPLPMQAELLRIIQEGTYKKLGSNIWKQTNFRLISATNRDLKIECEKGCFRSDLYDRISLWKCYMPTLDERKEDIPLLVDHFLKRKFPEAAPVIDDSVMEYLVQRSYPGNIRELQNLIARIALKYIGKGPITFGDIPEYDRNTKFQFERHWYDNPHFTETITDALNSGFDVKNIMDNVKSMVTKIALASAGSNKEVSQRLGKSERWIQLQKAKEK